MRAFVPALKRLRRRVLRFLILALLTAAPAGLEGQAVRQEQRDSAVRVWVNTGSGVYHCPGTRYYGNTRAGKYLSETDARGQGYRPAYGRVCGPIAAGSDPVPASGAVSTALPARSMVWVNTSSGVYHCPGTRYYGATKRGKYMTESDALAGVTGHLTGRPAAERCQSSRSIWRAAVTMPLGSWEWCGSTVR